MSLQKLMALMNPREEEEEEEEDLSRMQTDVTDEEMALRYELIPSDAEALRVPTVAHFSHTQCVRRGSHLLFFSVGTRV